MFISCETTVCGVVASLADIFALHAQGKLVNVLEQAGAITKGDDDSDGDERRSSPRRRVNFATNYCSG